MNKISKLFAVSALAILIFAAGCGDDNGGGPSGPGPFNAVTLTLYSMATLEQGYYYKVWAAKNDARLAASPTTDWAALAEFNIRSGGMNAEGQSRPDTIVNMSNVIIADGTFKNLSVNLDDYDSMFITIQSPSGSSTTPSSTVYMRSEIPDSLEDSSVRGLSFSATINTGINSFVVATPTDDNPDDELSGVWFYRNLNTEEPGLELDPAPTGWRWEGWVWHDGIWLSTGRFIDPEASDDFSGDSGTVRTPGVPGEDFLFNAPAGVTFPWVLAQGDSVAVTLEPEPDPTPGQFRTRMLQAHFQADPSPFALLLLALPTNSSGDPVDFFPGGTAWYRRTEDL